MGRGGLIITREEGQVTYPTSAHRRPTAVRANCQGPSRASGSDTASRVLKPPPAPARASWHAWRCHARPCRHSLEVSNKSIHLTSAPASLIDGCAWLQGSDYKHMEIRPSCALVILSSQPPHGQHPPPNRYGDIAQFAKL